MTQSPTILIVPGPADRLIAELQHMASQPAAT